MATNMLIDKSKKERNNILHCLTDLPKQEFVFNYKNCFILFLQGK